LVIKKLILCGFLIWIEHSMFSVNSIMYIPNDFHVPVYIYM
jgi:hypothetical protein